MCVGRSEECEGEERSVPTLFMDCTCKLYTYLPTIMYYYLLRIPIMYTLSLIINFAAIRLEILLSHMLNW